MSLNCNEINKILEELNLKGSFIQDIVQPGFDTLALYTYKNSTPTTVLICTKPNACRINETKRKIPKNDKPLRFMEFLRAKIRGCKITDCYQIGLERCIKIELLHNSENEFFFMYIRLWSNAGNIILCDTENKILDTMYRRPAKNEITGGVFTPPIPRANEFETQNKWQIRKFEEIEKNYKEKKLEKEDLSFNQKIDIWYSEYAQSLSREALLEQAQKWYNARKSRQKNALERLIEKRKTFQNASLLKHQGDLILSFGYLIDGKSNFLDCEDYENGNKIRIKIDPTKNAQENAAMYYTRYKKENSGAEELIHEIEMSKKALAALEKSYQSILNEKNPVKIEQLLRHNSKPKQQEKKAHPGLDYTVDGWYILVGRDSNENDDLLRHYVKGHDLWMHTRDYPGGFVFIKNRPNKTIPLEIMLYAGNLAVYYSKARKAGKADLYYTQVKHLRRAKNAPKGLVLPTQEKNLTIKLDMKYLKKLDEIKADELF